MTAHSLDPRLSLVFDLYDPCDLGADIGTDHAHLPAALLQRGRCRHMILTDISEGALQNARSEIRRFRLSDRVDFRLGDGLLPLEEKCGMISITGMGGRTIRDILLAGRERLRGAGLVLSAHTDLPLIREAVEQVGYRLEREEPCLSAGRYYLVLRARPGREALSGRVRRLGGPLFFSSSPQLVPYLVRRREVLAAGLRGLLSASCPQEALIAQVQEDILFYDAQIEKLKEAFHDRTGPLPSD